MILQKTLETLEFNKILGNLREFSVNEDTAGKISALTPDSDYDNVLKLLEETTEADKILHIDLVNPIISFDKIDTVLAKAPIMSVLTLAEILRTGRFLRAGRIFKSSVNGLKEKYAIFSKMASDIYIDNNLENEIERCILSEDTVSDRATQNLNSIRGKIRRLNESIKEKLDSIMRSNTMQKYLQDNIVTLRQGRYVVPVKSEFRSNVPGLVHDQSTSGATVFIEPMAVVEANNELKILYLEENREIEKILYDFTKKICDICSLLKINLDILINADLIFSKAKYAKAIKANRPEINSHCKINIVDGKHPLIEPKKVVPVSISMGNNYKILIITGPNTGGKTVTLKLCGLMSVMAMCGMFIPCAPNSSLSVFDNIFCDIGDEQSIEQSLSTFSSHIKNIANIVNGINGKTLVLLDELGAGTDPKEGAALALSIIDFLLKSNATALITTHYSELKEYSFIKDGIENASMDFNPETFAPTYKLNIGIPGSSNAIEIAKRLKLNPEIIANAKSHLSSDKIAFENVIKSAEKSRYEAEQIRTGLLAEKIEYDKTLEEIKKERDSLRAAKENLLISSKIEAKKIISEAKMQADEIINELKELYNGNLSDYTLNEARQLKNKLEISVGEEIDDNDFKELKPINLENLKVTDTVYVKSLNNNGVIAEINVNKKETAVLIGNILTRVKFSDLFATDSRVERNEEKVKSGKISAGISISADKSPALEINLLGQNTLEAVENAEVFLDNAIIQGFSEVKIIHGVGTGALKSAVHQMLKSHKKVKEFRLGRYGEGESGVTIIKLK